MSPKRHVRCLLSFLKVEHMDNSLIRSLRFTCFPFSPIAARSESRIAFCQSFLLLARGSSVFILRLSNILADRKGEPFHHWGDNVKTWKSVPQRCSLSCQGTVTPSTADDYDCTFVDHGKHRALSCRCRPTSSDQNHCDTNFYSAHLVGVRMNEKLARMSKAGRKTA